MSGHAFVRLFTGLSLLSVWYAVPASAGPPQPATNDEIKELLASAGESADYDGADQVIVLDEADVVVAESGLATTDSCVVVKLLTDAAVQSHSVVRLDYDPDTYRVTLKSVRIHRKNGDVEDVSLSGMITQPTRQWLIFWGGEQYLLPIPRLEVGDALETRISKTGFNIAYLDQSGSASGGCELQPPMPGHWHETTRFQGRNPIIRKRYSVHMPKDKPVQYEVYNGELKNSLWFDGDHLVYTFLAENVPAIKREPHMVSLDDCATKVVMATLPDWEMKSRWFDKANENQFAADDAIRQKVAELTKGLTTEAAKIAALNHWVADNVRYYGTSRGPREGFTLHRGIETFRDRGGVCKDKAGMLVTMLRAAGIDAYPALTMAGARVEAIPADQFNHTVTVVRNHDGTFDIYDPTWIPLSREMWSSREALQGLVYGTPEGKTLTHSPYYPPEYNQATVKAESRIDAKGALHTDIRFDLKGYCGTYLRRYIYEYANALPRPAFEDAMNIAPNAVLERFDYIDPFDYSRDAWATMSVSADDYAAGAHDLRAFHLPLMSHPLRRWLIPDFFYPVDVDTRQYGMRMRATRLIKYQETIKLPDGWTIEHVPDNVTLDESSASLKFDATPGDNELTYTFEFALKDHIIPPDNYPGFKKAVEEMNKLCDGMILCRVAEGKGGAVAARATQ